LTNECRLPVALRAQVIADLSRGAVALDGQRVQALIGDGIEQGDGFGLRCLAGDFPLTAGCLGVPRLRCLPAINLGVDVAALAQRNDRLPLLSQPNRSGCC
jgi:hypothetical protein